MVGPKYLAFGLPADTIPASLRPRDGEDVKQIMRRVVQDIGYDLKVPAHCYRLPSSHHPPVVLWPILYPLRLHRNDLGRFLTVDGMLDAC